MKQKCRPDCGICCIIPSISSAIPGMPEGKPAGVRCIHLKEDYSCDIYEKAERPEVCRNFLPDSDFCGNTREEAEAIQLSLLNDSKTEY